MFQADQINFFYLKYCSRAVISRGLYIFTQPLLEGQKHFFKEDFSENSAVSIQGYVGAHTLCD